MMKTLLILRHGKSSWSNDDLADHERPLKKRGTNDAARIGNLIRDEDIIPEVIISSTAKRAKDTTLIVADACGFDGELIFSRSLYHGFSSDYVQIINGVEGADVIMIVGHNPGLEEFLTDLIDEDEWLSTATLAQVGLDIDDWAEFDMYTEGKLINIWRPRELT